MMTRPRFHPVALVAALAVLLLVGGCNRNIEPYDPTEQVEAPDLSRIFPEGATRAEQSGAPGGGAPMPAPPPGSRGTAAARPAGAGGGPPPAGVPGDDAEPMRGVVRVSEELAARIPPGASVFVFARTVDGMPPTAAKKFEGVTFPLEFSLGPEDRMIKQFPFEGPFTINARIDADGNAMTRNPGDLQGSSPGHMPGAEGVEVLIDEVL